MWVGEVIESNQAFISILPSPGVVRWAFASIFVMDIALFVGACSHFQ